jgi:hypothetical protein
MRCAIALRALDGTRSRRPMMISGAPLPATKVVEKGGHYVLALKGNQGTLFDDVRLYLDDPGHASALLVSKRVVDGDHGRIGPARPSSAAGSTGLRNTSGLGCRRSARFYAPAHWGIGE